MSDNRTKVIYAEGSWETVQSFQVAVIVEKFFSNEYASGYNIGYVLSWRVTGDPTQGYRQYATTTEEGRELITAPGAFPDMDDAKAIRRAIAKYDELAAKYPQEKSDE